MKAKYILASLIVALTSIIPASAQNAADGEEYAFDAPFLGLRGSLDISCPGKWKVNGEKIKLFGAGCGVNLGVVYNYPIGGGMYLEPGIGVFYDTMDAEAEMASVEGIPEYKTYNAWVGTLGLHIPLMVGYRVDFTPTSALFLSTGPQLEIGFNAHLTDDQHEGSSLAGELYNTLLRRFDCQWKVGAGVAFNYHYYVGVEAAFGLANIAKHPEHVKFHRNLVQVTVGYNF